VNLDLYVLLGCSLLVAGGMAGWYAHGRLEQRPRRSREPPEPTVLENIAEQRSPAEALKQHDRAEAAPPLPREWDGGPLRPNLTRQITLAGGLR